MQAIGEGRRGRWGLTALLVGLLMAGQAARAADGAGAQDAQQLAQRDSRGACSLYYEGILSNPKDRQASRRYVECLLRVDRHESAVAELERIRVFYPDAPGVNLNLARLYYTLESYQLADARAQDVLQSADASAEQQRSAQRLVARVRTQQRRHRAFVSLFLGGSYQTNASRGPNDEVIELADQPILIDPDDREEDDFTAFGLLNGGYRYDLGTQGDTLELNAVGYAEKYADLEQIDTFYGSVDAGPRLALEKYGLGETSLRIFGGARHMTVDEETNFNAARLGLNHRQQIAREIVRDVTFTAEQRWFNDTDVVPANSNRDGQVFSLTYELADRIPEPAGWHLLGRYEYASLDKDFESYHGLTAGAGVDYRFRQGIVTRGNPETVYATGRLQGRHYLDPDPLIDPGSTQRTVDLTLAAGHEIRLSQFAWISWEVGYEKSFSNYEIDEYENAYVQLGIGFSWY